MKDRAVLALPGFPAPQPGADEAARALPRLPALEWLLARGRPAGRSGQPWRAWVLERCGLAAGLLEELPAGPATRLASGRPLAVGEAQDWWLCAQPVHLIAGLDRLQLAPPQSLRLQLAEAESLRESLAATLEPAGLQLELLDASHWLLRSAQPFEVEVAEAAVALGEDLRTLRPRGPDARRLLALRGEMEMSLHDHPVNRLRAQRGLPVVNSLWLHGAGRIGSLEQTPLAPLASDDPWLRGLWRALGASAQPCAPPRPASGRHAGVFACAMAAWPGTTPASLRELDAQLVEPLRAALAGATLESLEILLGDRTWRVTARDRLRFWRRNRPLHESGS
jgi:hypothetical protein